MAAGAGGAGSLGPFWEPGPGLRMGACGAQRTGGAGRATGAEGGWPVAAGAAAGDPAAPPMRSIVSTSKGTPAARRACVTTSAGAEGSARGSRIVTR